MSPFLAFSWNDLADLALAVFLFSVGLSLASAFIRLGGTLGRVSSFSKGTQEERLPVINTTGGTVSGVVLAIVRTKQFLWVRGSYFSY